MLGSLLVEEGSELLCRDAFPFRVVVAVPLVNRRHHFEQSGEQRLDLLGLPPGLLGPVVDDVDERLRLVVVVTGGFFR
jgi:hypothetical protein